MINPDELWIGDWIIHPSQKLKGQFHGLNAQNHVLLKTKETGILSFPAAELEKTEDEPDQTQQEYTRIDQEEIDTFPESDFGDTIDLHYEQLTLLFPHQQGSKLEFQLDICTRFIQSGITSRLPNIQIIHGRGQGILKEEVERLLKQYPEITIISSNPNLASVDAWMNYH